MEMKKTSHLLIILLMFSLILGCAGGKTIQFVSKPNSKQVKSNHARIVIKGSNQFQDMSTSIKDNDIRVGQVGHGGTLIWDRPAGLMEITGSAVSTFGGNWDLLPVELNVGKGRTYVLKIGISGKEFDIISGEPVSVSLAESYPSLTTEIIAKDKGFLPPVTTPAVPTDETALPFDFGKYYALVVGNNDYRYLPKLDTAINDAQAIASLLQDKYGFKVKLLINATRADILVAINSYRRTLTINDNLLIYYAGHGWLDKDADQGYWLPTNATRESQVEWVSNSAVTSEIRAIQAKHVMVVADSCYSGKLSRGLQITQKTPDYLAQISRKKARVVLSSGGLEPVMDSGGKGNHSVFASAFIEALGENNGVLDGTTLFTKVREQVGWNADQIPEYSNIHKAGHDGGDFIFVRNK